MILWTEEDSATGSAVELRTSIQAIAVRAASAVICRMEVVGAEIESICNPSDKSRMKSYGSMANSNAEVAVLSAPKRRAMIVRFEEFTMAGASRMSTNISCNLRCIGARILVGDVHLGLSRGLGQVVAMEYRPHETGFFVICSADSAGVF